MIRRDRSRSTFCRLTMTGWLTFSLSATSWAWLNEVGATTWGLADDTGWSGRTTAVWGRSAGSPPRPEGCGRTAGAPIVRTEPDEELISGSRSSSRTGGALAGYRLDAGAARPRSGI